ncbi:MAG: hypothetical protein FJ267_19510, partial [Planctomycetes bacterium]|nr:hypothetical protein [Planctomycetota bacterium]
EQERGFVGGLLVTNKFGRPLEFQCTAPVKPNRAQQILYGPTLRPFVLSELIGRTLVEKVSAKPHLVLIDTDSMLDLRQHIPIPVGYVRSLDTKQNSKSDFTTQIGKVSIVVHPDFEKDLADFDKSARQIPHEANLIEPFERIHEALAETLKIGTAKTA